MLPGKDIVDEEELMGTWLTRISSEIKWVMEVVTEVLLSVMLWMCYYFSLEG